MKKIIKRTTKNIPQEWGSWFINLEVINTYIDNQLITSDTWSVDIDYINWEEIISEEEIELAEALDLWYKIPKTIEEIENDRRKLLQEKFDNSNDKVKGCVNFRNWVISFEELKEDFVKTELSTTFSINFIKENWIEKRLEKINDMFNYNYPQETLNNAWKEFDILFI
jgi:hypothetical protein